MGTCMVNTGTTTDGSVKCKVQSTKWVGQGAQ